MAGRLIAFGEAKTFDDIDTGHTRRQLEVLGKTYMKGLSTPCPLYMGIPRSAAYELDRVLIDAGLLGAKHIVRIHVPDILLKDTDHASSEDYRTSA